ncbi:MAG: DNA repair protein RecO [Pirellulaceae bacterium]|nr:DNA repair protein RecO [Pirellulaceae bacterium]
MSLEKTSAIVLRLVDFSETSCVVTLFTEDFGKIGALAKGARRPKGPFDSALDLLALCRIVFIHKSSEALDLLTEAKLLRRFRAASRDLSRLYAAYYVAELLLELTEFGDPHPELFGESERALSSLDQEGNIAETVMRFEMSALRQLGYLPALDVCAVCGSPVPAEGRVLFGHLAGGVLCQTCRPGQRQVVSLSRESWDALRSWEQMGLAPERFGDEFQPPVDDPKVRGELRGLMNHYLTNLLGHPPRMQKYLGMLAT